MGIRRINYPPLFPLVRTDKGRRLKNITFHLSFIFRSSTDEVEIKTGGDITQNGNTQEGERFGGGGVSVLAGLEKPHRRAKIKA